MGEGGATLYNYNFYIEIPKFEIKNCKDCFRRLQGSNCASPHTFSFLIKYFLQEAQNLNTPFSGQPFTTALSEMWEQETSLNSTMKNIILIENICRASTFLNLPSFGNESDQNGKFGYHNHESTQRGDRELSCIKTSGEQMRPEPPCRLPKKLTGFRSLHFRCQDDYIIFFSRKKVFNFFFKYNLRPKNGNIA